MTSDRSVPSRFYDEPSQGGDQYQTRILRPSLVSLSSVPLRRLPNELRSSEHQMKPDDNQRKSVVKVLKPNTDRSTCIRAGARLGPTTKRHLVRD